VSEEAAQINEVTGETMPELEQGTPVQEVHPQDQGGAGPGRAMTDHQQILERDPELRETAPEVLKDKLQHEQHQAESAGDAESTTFENLLALGQIEAIAHGGEASDVTAATVGYKFPLPELPLPPFSNRKERYDPVVDQVTNLIMKDGKLSVAQRVSPTTLHSAVSLRWGFQVRFRK